MSEAYAEPPIQVPHLQIPRRENLSYEDFVRDHLLANRPVIVTDAIREWRALSRWSPEFFKAEFGAVEMQLRGERMSVGEAVDRILEPEEGQPAPYLHTTSAGGKMEHRFPGLLADIRPLPVSSNSGPRFFDCSSRISWVFISTNPVCWPCK